jgi:hypothetical protein
MVTRLIDSVKTWAGSIGKRPSGGAPGPGNSACAHFCNTVFPPGAERGRCKSEAAQNRPGNLCDACEADAGRVCSAPDGTRSCCAPDETCNTDTGGCNGTVTECTYEQCRAESDDPNATCCGTECGLVVLAPCDPDNDLCCGTLNGNPDASHCKDVSDTYPEIGHRCCLGSNSHPCSGIGGDHCEPDSPCSTCCSGLCGPITDEATGHAVCID